MGIRANTSGERASAVLIMYAEPPPSPLTDAGDVTYRTAISDLTAPGEGTAEVAHSCV